MRMIRLILLSIVGLVLAAQAVAGDQPVELVQNTTDRIWEALQDNRAEFERDSSGLEDVIRELLLPNIDTEYTARLVLGRHGRSLESEQIGAFADALAEVLITRYADGLLMFESRDQVEILPLAGENTERMTRVRTRIRLDSGSRVPVDYVFRKRGDDWKVFDVIVEGISYVTTFRNQVDEEIRSLGFDRMLSRIQAGEVEFEEIENGAGE